ncbi:hypothetical protein ABPG74_015636 [Tetrahymena malaccensis]
MSFKQDTKQQARDKEFSSAHQKFEYWIKNPESHTQNMFNKQDDFILTDQEKMIAGDIVREYNKKLDDFKRFMNREYLSFDYKIHKCMYNHCYDDIFKSTTQVNQCIHKCHQGIEKADKFVNKQMDDFNLEFNTCLEKAQKRTKDIMNESFKCYDEMLNRFNNLKRMIKTEMDYYQ